jgi:hypothetical protein
LQATELSAFSFIFLLLFKLNIILLEHKNVLCDYKFACKGINIRGKTEFV